MEQPSPWHILYSPPHTYTHAYMSPLGLCEPLYFPAIIPFQSAGRWLLTADSTSSFQMDCFCEITSLSWPAISLGEK